MAKSFPTGEVEVRVWPGAPEPLEQIWVGGIRFGVSQDGYCYDHEAIDHLLKWATSRAVPGNRAASGGNPEGELFELCGHLRERYRRGRRLGGFEVLMLADSLGKRAEPARPEGPPDPGLDRRSEKPPLSRYWDIQTGRMAPGEPAARPADPPPEDCEPLKPGLDYVPRRLLGVLFLTPFMLFLVAVYVLVRLVQLALWPDWTRQNCFPLDFGGKDLCLIAYDEDLDRTAGVVAAATAAGYAALAAWFLWFPVQAVLAQG